MPRADRTPCHRRTFFQASAATLVGAARPLGAAPAPRTADEPVELPDLPIGVVRRLGSPLFRGPVANSTLAFTPDSRRLVGCGFDPDLPGLRVTVWDAATGRRTAFVPLRSAEPNPSGSAPVATAFPTADVLAIAGLDAAGALWIDRVGLATGGVLDRTTGTIPFAGQMTAFSPDFGTIVTATNRPGPNNQNEAEVTAFAFPGGDKLWSSVRTGGYVYQPTLSPDGERVLIASGLDLSLLDTRTGKVTHSLDGTGVQYRQPVGFTPDGRSVVFIEIGGKAYPVGVWDVTTGEVRKLEGAEPGQPVLPTGEGIQTRGGGTIGVWDPATGKRVRDIPIPADLFPWVPSPDGRSAAKAFGGAVQVWDATTGRMRPGSADPPGEVQNLGFDGPGKLTGRVGLLAVASVGQAMGDGVRVGWDTTTGAATPAAAPFERLIDTSPDRRSAVVIGPRCGLELRDPATRAVVRPLKTDIRLPALACPGGRYTRDGTRFVAATIGGTQVLVWDVATGEPEAIPVTLQGAFANVVINGLALSGSDTAVVRLATPPGAGQETDDTPKVAVVDLRTGKQAVVVRGPWRVTDVAVTPDTARVACATTVPVQTPDGPRFAEEVRVFDTATATQLCALPTRTDLPGPTPVPAPVMALSRDGRTIVTATGRTATAWEVATGKVRTRFAHQGEVTGAAVGPDGRVIAIASRDAPVWVWEFLGPPRRGVAVPDPAGVWAGLGSFDAAAGFEAVRAIARYPDAGCRFLADRLPPAAAPDPARVRDLVTRLDADEFRTRDAAERALADLDGRGLAVLRSVTDPSPEAASRLGRVIARAASPTPTIGDGLRAVRAVEAAEWAAVGGSTDAANLLARWAAGDPGARLTREAAAALVRLRG